MTAVADALGVTRQHLSAMRNRPPPRPRGRPPLPDAELVADIRLLVADLPTYGYRRVHALLRRQAEQTGRAAPTPKRVYRVMKVHGLLLQRDGEHHEERRHDGRVAVEQRNTRWCSDGLEIACDNGEKARVAFALDCCADASAAAEVHAERSQRARASAPAGSAPRGGVGTPILSRAKDDQAASAGRLMRGLSLNVPIVSSVM